VRVDAIEHLFVHARSRRGIACRSSCKLLRIVPSGDAGCDSSGVAEGAARERPVGCASAPPAVASRLTDLLPRQQEVTRAAGASANGAVARARPVTRSRSADLPVAPTERDLSCLEVVDLELLHVGRGRKSLVAKALKSWRKPVRHERVERLA